LNSESPPKRTFVASIDLACSDGWKEQFKKELMEMEGVNILRWQVEVNCIANEVLLERMLK